VDQGNNGLSRGDRNRNARLAALRAVLPRDHAILGIDLAQSRQAAVLADHDSRVLARWRPRCSPWMLGELLDRALTKLYFRSQQNGIRPEKNHFRIGAQRPPAC
jgi:hypothetical protein